MGSGTPTGEDPRKYIIIKEHYKMRMRDKDLWEFRSVVYRNTEL